MRPHWQTLFPLGPLLVRGSFPTCPCVMWCPRCAARPPLSFLSLALWFANVSVIPVARRMKRTHECSWIVDFYFNFLLFDNGLLKNFLIYVKVEQNCNLHGVLFCFLHCFICLLLSTLKKRRPLEFNRKPPLSSHPSTQEVQQGSSL